MKRILLVNVQSISDIITNSSTELFLIQSKNADPRNVLPEGFPYVGSLQRFPIGAYRAWESALDKLKTWEEREEFDFVDLLKKNGITEDFYTWLEMFSCIQDQLYEEGRWTRAKYQLYERYLCDPRSKHKVTSKTLGEHYPPIDPEDFSLWALLEKHVKDNFSEYPVPYNQELYSGYNKFNKYKNRVCSDGSKMTAYQYSEFLCYVVGERYAEEFIRDNKSIFPYLSELLDMYNGGYWLSSKVLESAWFSADEDSEVNRRVVDYGEDKYYSTLDNLFGKGRYHFLRLNM